MISDRVKTILLVEDEAVIAIMEKRTLQKYGYKVITVTTGESALKTLDETPEIDLILMDINLGEGMDGTQAAEIILKKYSLPLIFLSSHTERDVVEKTEGITSFGYIVKNSGETVLIASIKMAFRLFESRLKEMESDAFRKRVFESSIVPIVVMDGTTLNYIDCNPAAVSMYGFNSREEILGRTLFDLSSPIQYNGEDSSVKARHYFDLAITKGMVVYEWLHQRPGGDLWDAEVHMMSFYSNGNLFLQFTLQDITERKQFEEMQQIQHNLNHDLNSCRDLHQGLDKVLKAVLKLDCIDCGAVYLTDPADGSLNMIVHHGLSSEFAAHVSHFDSDSPNIKLVRAGKALHGTYEDIFKDRDEIRVNEGLLAFSTIPIMSHEQLIAVLNLASHTNTSIPEDTRISLETIAAQIGGTLLRLHTDEALKESEEIFKQFMDHSPIYVFFKDDKIRPLRLSRNYESMLGRPLSELLGKSMDELFPSELAKTMVADDIGILNQGKVITVEEEFNGHYYSTIKFPIHIQGKPRYLSGYTIDITESKLAAEELRKSEEKYRSIVNMTDEWIWEMDLNGNHIFSNPRITEILGYNMEEFLKKGSFHFIHPEDKKEVMTQLPLLINSKLGWKGWTIRWRHKNGEYRYLESNAGPILDKDGNLTGYRGTDRDVTERKLAEETILRTAKLDSLGVLAGGVAHDFNNLLTGIFGYIDIACAQSEDKKVTGYLSKAMNTINRASDLTRQLLTFSMGGQPVRQIGRLFPFIRETALFALSGSNISCHFDIEENLMSADFDKNQIGQVIDNLIINAHQAMPKGGEIRLVARNITLQDKEHPIMTKGNYVKIAITDCGTGISREHLSRIFDPFFTTKEKGNGLGLATCYSIVSRHGGCIDVESEPGKGSTFQILLPAVTDISPSAIAETAVSRKGSGTILVMDDNEEVRDITGLMLKHIGYDVVFKENGIDAINFLSVELKANRILDGIIFDLTVPGGVGGREAIPEIRKLSPDIPVFVSSGYAEDPVMVNPADYGFTASICKPFRMAELSNMIEKYLKNNV